MSKKSFSVLALTCAVSSIGLMLAGDALALPAEGYRSIYMNYNESTGLYEIVGKETLACNGAHIMTGSSGDYVNTEYTLCAERSQKWTICDVPEFCWY